MKIPAIEAVVAPAFVKRGCVNVISLSIIKTHAAARWEKMRGTICARLESILRQRLGSADFFVELDDLSYVVVMPASDPSDAQVCCLRVAYELHTSLLGPCAIEDLHLAHATGIDAGRLSVDRIVTPHILDLADRAGLQEIVQQHRATAISPSQIVSKPVVAQAAQKPSVPSIALKYWPMWDARREAITAYRCVSRRAPAHAAPAAHSAMTNAVHPAMTKEEISHAILEFNHAMEDLARQMERGQRFLLDFPVSFDVLSAPLGRMEMASACRALRADYRSYLLFELCDLPVGVPASRLHDLVTTLKPFGKGVMAHVPFKAASYVAYQSVNLTAIGFSLPRQMPVAEQCEEIDRLIAGAKRCSLMSFVWDIVHPDVVNHACEAGVNFLGGETIAAAEPSPSQVRRLARAALDQRLKNVVSL